MKFFSTVLGFGSVEDVADIEKRSFLRGPTYSLISDHEHAAGTLIRHRGIKSGVIVLNICMFVVSITFLALSRPQDKKSEPRGMNSLLKQTNAYCKAP
jgi:hypothetical protein